MGALSKRRCWRIETSADAWFFTPDGSALLFTVGTGISDNNIGLLPLNDSRPSEDAVSTAVQRGVGGYFARRQMDCILTATSRGGRRCP